MFQMLAKILYHVWMPVESVSTFRTDLWHCITYHGIVWHDAFIYVDLCKIAMSKCDFSDFMVCWQRQSPPPPHHRIAVRSYSIRKRVINGPVNTFIALTETVIRYCLEWLLSLTDFTFFTTKAPKICSSSRYYRLSSTYPLCPICVVT